MSDKDYMVVISPLLTHKIDEISNTISSSLEEVKTSLKNLSKKIDNLEKKVSIIETKQNTLEFVSKDYWKSSE